MSLAMLFHLLCYFTSYVLNMFWTLICPSSGACDCVVELPHRSSCSHFVVCWRFGAAGFEWCSFCRLKHKTCWAHKKWNKTTSDIKLVFRSSTITMMHGPINIRFRKYLCKYVEAFVSFIYIRGKEINKFSLVCSKWCECKELVFICVNKVSEIRLSHSSNSDRQRRSGDWTVPESAWAVSRVWRQLLGHCSSTGSIVPSLQGLLRIAEGGVRCGYDSACL